MTTPAPADSATALREPEPITTVPDHHGRVRHAPVPAPRPSAPAAAAPHPARAQRTTVPSFGHRGHHLPDPSTEPATRLPTRLLTFEQATARVVATLQDPLPLGLWAVTRRDGDQQVFIDVHHDTDAAAAAAGGAYDEVDTGTVVAWHGSMCQAMVDGAPTITADARTVPAHAATRPVDEWPVRTYLAAPITTPDGDLFGTLCGYGPHVRDVGALERMRPVVDLLAELLGQVLLSERLRQDADYREAHLHQLATRDHLTGLATRAVLHDRLAHALELHHAGARGLARLSADTGCPVYFCDPRSPWQRGTNKNTNRLLRQYLPRAADLRLLDQDALDALAARLNGRPREVLGWRTPAEVYTAATTALEKAATTVTLLSGALTP